MEWYNDNNTFISDYEELRLLKTRVKDRGIYTCRGVTESGQPFRSRLVINVSGMFFYNN